MMYDNHKLNAVYYYSLLNYSLDCAMRNTREINAKVGFNFNFKGKAPELEFICDGQEEMLSMFEKYVQGRISQMCEMRHARAYKGSD